MFAPKSYREMLNNLNWSTAITTFVYVAVITKLGFTRQLAVDQSLVPPIKDYKDLLDWATGSFGLIPILAAGVAFLLSWAFEIHNVVSKAIQVRYLWDKYLVAKPLRGIAGSQVPLRRATVRRVMNEFYYPQLKLLDQHYVELFWRYALVFWILFEHL
ncbi:MAG: hypothetical protein WB760_05760, partial [Xanthobacteraceae bacterium]